MRFLATLTAVLFLAAGAAAAQDTKKPATSQDPNKPATAQQPKKPAGAADTKAGVGDADKVARGQKLYAENKCAPCHSVGGKGNPKGPLDSVGSKLSPEEIRQWLINPSEMTGKTKATRKPPMPSYAKLTKEDVEALVAYLSSLKK